MSKRLFKALVAVGIVAALAVVSVTASADEMKANIPFSFKVNGKTLSAGAYQFSTSAAGALLVRGHSGGAFVLTNRLESSKVTQAKAVFHRYGDRYILVEVWTGAGSGRDVPEPRRGERERELASFERVVIPLS